MWANGRQRVSGTWHLAACACHHCDRVAHATYRVPACRVHTSTFVHTLQVFSMTFNAFLEFARNCHIIGPHCSGSSIEFIWVQVNAMQLNKELVHIDRFNHARRMVHAANKRTPSTAFHTTSTAVSCTVSSHAQPHMIALLPLLPSHQAVSLPGRSTGAPRVHSGARADCHRHLHRTRSREISGGG